MRVFDADQYTRICYYPESESYQRIVDLFGNEILDESGEADRRKIAAIVFNDAQKRQALDKIIHPEVEQGLEKFFAGHAGDPLVFAEIPLLDLTKLPFKVAVRKIVTDAGVITIYADNH